MEGLSGNIWGYVFGGQVIKNINDLIAGHGDDNWDKMAESDRVRLVVYLCSVGAIAVLKGEYYSLDDVFTDGLREVGREYGQWRQLTGTIKYFDNYINPTKSEITIALNIIQQGETNPTAALSRLRTASFEFVSKTEVANIINGVDPSFDTTPDDNTTALTTNAGFSLDQFTQWLSNNKLVVAGIGALVLAALAVPLFFEHQQVEKPQPKKLQ